jgi:tetratricopeptide (TPR) repeat protein
VPCESYRTLLGVRSDLAHLQNLFRQIDGSIAYKEDEAISAIRAVEDAIVSSENNLATILEWGFDSIGSGLNEVKTVLEKILRILPPRYGESTELTDMAESHAEIWFEKKRQGHQDDFVSIYDKAHEFYKEAINRFPENMRAYIGLARLFLANNKLAEAEACLRDCQAYAEKYGLWVYCLRLIGRVRFCLDDEEGAYQALKIATAYDPHSHPAYYDLAQYAALTNRHDEAMEIIQSLVEWSHIYWYMLSKQNNFDSIRDQVERFRRKFLDKIRSSIVSPGIPIKPDINEISREIDMIIARGNRVYAVYKPGVMFTWPMVTAFSEDSGDVASVVGKARKSNDLFELDALKKQLEQVKSVRTLYLKGVNRCLESYRVSLTQILTEARNSLAHPGFAIQAFAIFIVFGLIIALAYLVFLGHHDDLETFSSRAHSLCPEIREVQRRYDYVMSHLRVDQRVIGVGFQTSKTTVYTVTDFRGDACIEYVAELNQYAEALTDEEQSVLNLIEDFPREIQGDDSATIYRPSQARIVDESGQVLELDDATRDMPSELYYYEIAHTDQCALPNDEKLFAKLRLLGKKFEARPISNTAALELAFVVWMACIVPSSLIAKKFVCRDKKRVKALKKVLAD